VLVFVSWSLGCGEEFGAPGAVVGSAVDTEGSFSLAESKLEHTSTDVYGWSCKSPQAELSIEGSLSEGTFRLEILDGAGSVVHDNTYSASFQFSLASRTRPAGVPGLWTLRFTFSNATWSGSIELEEDSGNDDIEIDGSYDFSGALQFQVGGASGHGTVEVASSHSQGGLRIRVWDGQGVLRYDRTISGPSNTLIDETTQWGSAGVWNVRLDFLSAVGGSSILLSPP